MKTGNKQSIFLYMLIIASCAVSCGTEMSETVFYVSPEGSDTWNGSKSNPFATVTQARDAVRALKKNAPLEKPVTISLRGGLYELSEPILFTPDDSGTEFCPVTYSAYPGEIPVLSGGRKITGWKQREK